MGRAQRVIVNGGPSDWQPVSNGVPQGSALCPVLFTKNLDAGLEGILSLQRTEFKEELLTPSKTQRPCRDTSTN